MHLSFAAQSNLSYIKSLITFCACTESDLASGDVDATMSMRTLSLKPDITSPEVSGTDQGTHALCECVLHPAPDICLFGLLKHNTKCLCILFSLW